MTASLDLTVQQCNVADALRSFLGADTWLQMLRKDRTAIFAAARHVGAASEFIVAKEMPLLDEFGEDASERQG